MSNILICDFDGVLADCSHRLHYLKEKNYDAFYAPDQIANDNVIMAGIDFYFSLQRYYSYSDIYLLTGRPERTRNATRCWLEQHGIKYVNLIMRRDNDYRPSPQVKTELVQGIVNDRQLCGLRSSAYFIDDDPENVKAISAAFPNMTGLTFGTERMTNGGRSR